MMHVLLIGGTGRLGSALYRHLEEHGYFVENLVRPDYDLMQPEALVGKIRNSGRTGSLTAVINAAGMTNIDLCTARGYESHWMNGIIPGILAEACRDSATPFIHFSTDQVFGPRDGYTQFHPNDNPLAVRPDGRPKWPAINRYGRDKAIGEAHALLYDKTSVCRVQWLYGSKPTWVDDVVAKLRAGADVEAIEDYCGHPTSAWDVAEAVRRILTEQKRRPVYHLVPRGQALSRVDLAKFIAGQLNTPVRVTSWTRDEMFAKGRWNAKRSSAQLQNIGGPELPHWAESLSKYLKHQQTVAA